MQRTVFAAFLGAVIIIMGFTACSEERYWTPDQSTGEEIRDIMKENWDLIEDVWGDADCGDFPDGSGSIPFIDSCNPSESDTKHYYEYNFDDG